MTETTTNEQTRGRRQVLTGTVASDACDKTITVVVETRVMHKLYKRYMKRTTRFAAHDETNQCKVGDRVTIVACRPMSRRKRWRVREILQQAGGAR